MNIFIKDASQTVQFYECNRKSYRVSNSGKTVSFTISFITNINYRYKVWIIVKPEVHYLQGFVFCVIIASLTFLFDFHCVLKGIISANTVYETNRFIFLAHVNSIIILFLSIDVVFGYFTLVLYCTFLLFCSLSYHFLKSLLMWGLLLRFILLIFTSTWFFNSIKSNVPFFYPLKTVQNQRFSNVFRGQRNGTLS